MQIEGCLIKHRGKEAGTLISGISATRLKMQGEQLQIINLDKGRQSSAAKIWNCELLSQVAPYSFPDAALNASSVLGSMTGAN